MIVILEAPIQPNAKTAVRMPKDSTLLGAGSDNNQIVLWLEASTDETEMVERIFVAVPSKQSFSDVPRTYVGSARCASGLVGIDSFKHVYELTEAP